MLFLKSEKLVAISIVALLAVAIWTPTTDNWIRKFANAYPSDGNGGSGQQTIAQLFVDPSLTEKTHSDIGTSFDVSIAITDIADLKGFDFNLTWDNNLLSLSNVDFTATLNNVWGTGNWYLAKNQSDLGYYKLVAVSTANSFSNVGPTSFARLTFLVEDPHSNLMVQTSIHFDTHKLSDSQSNSIQHTVVDGTYSMSAAVATLQVIPALTKKSSIDVGTTFKLNVTVQSVHDLFGFDINLTWNETLLTFSNCYFQNTLDSVWGLGNWFIAINENSPGSYRVVVVSTADSFNTTQSQTLFELELLVKDPSQPSETLIHFSIHKLSDSLAEPIAHTIEDGTYKFIETPRLDMNPVTKICRKVDESFGLAINVSAAINMTDFEFEIHYNTTLLDYVGVTWNVWGSGTINVDEAEGIVNGSTSGVAINGAQMLITVVFNSSYHHVWKSTPDWINDLSDVLFLQWANLSYLSSLELSYVRGGRQNQILVGPDFAYTFSPIRGDVNNDGIVDVFDLRTMAIYYMVKQGDPNWQPASTYDLNGDQVVDVFDLRTAASNFGYIYSP